MNSFPDTLFWLRTLGVPSLQTLLLLALAGLLARHLRSARAQRAVWLATFAATVLLFAGSFAGADQRLADCFRTPPVATRVIRVQGNLPPTNPFPGLTADTSLTAPRVREPGRSTPAISRPDPGKANWWPAWVWLAGVLVVAGWRLVLSAMFQVWWRRRARPSAAAEQAHVNRLAAQLGLRCKVRVVEIPHLLTPIAFGLFRPRIGLPAGFGVDHQPHERDAMLAHELAHLAARDPLWLAFASAVCGALWWLPPVWWGRRQLRSACEAAADEASVVIQDGPAVLARCLVSLATRLPRRRAFALLGMAGFRSDLGRRVERLLTLSRSGLSPSLKGKWLALGSLAALAVAAVGLASSAWALPNQPEAQPPLLALARQAWAAAVAPDFDASPTPAATATPATTTAPAARESTPEAAASTSGTIANAGSAADGRGTNWMILDVQFQDAPSTNAERQTRLCMDALTRRLYATRQFSSVRCDPAEGGIKVQLQLKQGASLPTLFAGLNGEAGPDPTGGLRSLVERRGELEFRRVHPENERLVAAGECPAGFELLTMPTPGGVSPRRFVVEKGPALGLTGGHIEKAEAIQDPVSSDWRVSVGFDDEGRELFAALTGAMVNQMLAVVVDGELLMAPTVRQAITGGRCEISGRFTESEAGRLAAMLQHPLPVTLRLNGLVQPVDTVNPKQASEGAVFSVNAVGYVNFTPAGPAGTAGPPAGPGSETRSDPIGRTGTATNTAAILVQDARLLFEMGKLEEAKRKLEEALRTQPDHQAARHYLGLVLEAEGRKSRTLAPASDVPSTPQPGTVVVDPVTGQPTASAANTAAQALSTRTYRVSPTLLTQSLGSLLGTPATNTSAVDALRRLFTSAGVQLGTSNVLASASSPANAFQGTSGRALLFNDRTGTLLVRATLTDHDAIESVLQILNESPPQVTIEAKFVEITQEDSKALGFDWFLGNVQTPGASNAPNAGDAGPPAGGVFPGASSGTAVPTSEQGTHAIATLTGILSDPQFRTVVSALNAAGTNAPAPVDLRGDQLDWPGRSATNAGNIRISATLGPRITGILTDPQYRVTLRALEQRAGVDVLAAPRVTTVSGRQAQIQVVDIMTVVNGVNPAALVQPGMPPATNNIPFLTSSIPVGPILDVIPVVAADGYTISLTVIPTITEFIGYDRPVENSSVRVWEDGKEKPVAMPLPRFRVRQMHTQAQLWDGQTLVLGGFPVETTQVTKDKVPVLGDLPAVGSLFRSESKQTAKKNLLVFITATIVDPAGNRVHSEANTPYDPNTVPVGGGGNRVGR